MSASRRCLAIAICLSCTAALASLACDDDSSGGTSTGTDSGADASSTADSSTAKDGGSGSDGSASPDSGSDASPSDAGTDADATTGPTRKESVESTGVVRVLSTFAYAEFYVDDVVVRWSNAPDCVLVMRSPAKPLATAGTVTIGGEIVGKDGGPTNPVILDPDFDYYAEDNILPSTNEFRVDISQGPTSTSFASLPIQTVPTSLPTPLALLTPTAVDAGARRTIPIATPFELTWTAPSGPGDLTFQRVIVELNVSPSQQDTGRSANLFCGFPITSGKATIPAEVLQDMAAAAGGAPAGGLLAVFAGGQRTVTVKNTTYIIAVNRDDSTTFTSELVSLQ